MVRISFLLFVALCFVFTLTTPVYAKKPVEVLIIIKTSNESDLQTTLAITSKDNLGEQILKSKTKESEHKPELPIATIQIKKHEYVLDSYNRLFDSLSQREIMLSKRARTTLLEWVQRSQSAHYGKPLLWKEVKNEFKRMSYGEVIDLETGKRFRVQRRAGNRHADVQPLTKKDTKTMKEIYQGKWSWNRRAILLDVNGIKYAASMHGMPHGAGAIVGNNFSGHFCIHFRGSSTHRRSEPDPGHSLMLQKASGSLNQAIISAEPHQLVDYFLTSLQEQDFPTLQKTIGTWQLSELVKNIISIKLVDDDIEATIHDIQSAMVPVKINYVEKGNRRTQKGEWVYILKRKSPEERWKIMEINMNDQK